MNDDLEDLDLPRDPSECTFERLALVVVGLLIGGLLGSAVEGTRRNMAFMALVERGECSPAGGEVALPTRSTDGSDAQE